MKYLMMLALIFSTVGSFAQNQTLRKEKSRFYIGNERSNLSDFVSAMKDNREAYDLAVKAKSNYDIGTILGIAGGFLIAWPLGQGIREKDPNWNLAIAGVGAFVLAFPITAAAYNKFDRAIHLFNKGNSQQTGKLDLKITPSRMAFVYSF